MANDDGGRGYIVRRRAQLVAAALASVGGCTPQCNPLVCLSAMPADTGSPPVNPKQTLVGVARSGKAGAVIVVNDDPVYVEGLTEWPEAWVGKQVAVTGTVVERRGLPPTPPPKEAGIVGDYRVIEDATYVLIE